MGFENEKNENSLLRKLILLGEVEIKRFFKIFARQSREGSEQPESLARSFSAYCFEAVYLLGVFGPKRDEVTGNGEKYIMRSLVTCTPYPILCGW